MGTRRRARRIANPAAKGGTGKSTMIQSLTEGLAAAGQRVLVVDMDPQGNISRRLGARWVEGDTRPTLTEILRTEGGPVALGAARAGLRPCGWDVAEVPYAANIHVLPSRFDLEVRDNEAHQMGAVQRLRMALEGVDDDYDWTLIDCRPSLGHLSQNAMVAADLVLLSVNAENDSISAAVETQRFIRTHAGLLGNPDLEFAGLITSHYRANTSLHSDRFENTLPELFDADLIWAPAIPQAVSVADAIDRGEPILLGAPRVRPLIEMHTERLVTRHAAA